MIVQAICQPVANRVVIEEAKYEIARILSHEWWDDTAWNPDE